jgi:hypothetical protein
MTDFIATHSTLPVLTNEDRTYIQDNFYTLEELCLCRTRTPTEYRSQIRAGLLPRPAYVVDGTEMYPADFFLFPDSVGSLGAQMKEEFSARYVRAAKVYGDSPSEDRHRERICFLFERRICRLPSVLITGDHLSKGICDGENPGASGNARSKRR